MRKTDFKVIGFDADDTLWVNEPFFQDTEKRLCELLAPYAPAEEVSKLLFATEMQNLSLYGYGAKGFILSMIETALKISNNSVDQTILEKVVNLGKELINMPVTLLDRIPEVLDYLSLQGYTLIVATKGDLLDQQRKLSRSTLAKYFHHIEIMSDKKEQDYQLLLSRIGVNANEFLMIGNSFKSDIQPVLAIGGYGIHVPYHTTWQHEVVGSTNVSSDRFTLVHSIADVMQILRNGKNS